MDAEITQQQIIFLALYLKFNLSKIKQVKHSYTVNFWLVVPEIIESTNAYIFFKSFHYLRKTLALGRMFSLNMSIPLNLEEHFSCFTKFTNQITQRGSWVMIRHPHKQRDRHALTDTLTYKNTERHPNRNSYFKFLFVYLDRFVSNFYS